MGFEHDFTASYANGTFDRVTAVTRREAIVHATRQATERHTTLQHIERAASQDQTP